jgi:hypothetical protein
MPGKLPPPQANVDNVLPGLLEDIRKRREAAQAAGPGDTLPGERPTPGVAPAPAQPRAPEIEELRSQLRALRRLVGVALALVLALGVAMLLGWHP